jgi:tRNA(Arg) A34 adenosine deaminase TadA
VLAGPDGVVLAEERNREVTDADPTAHPELALARPLTPSPRAAHRRYSWKAGTSRAAKDRQSLVVWRALVR